MTMFAVVIVRVFTLQVLKGSSYQENFSEQIHKKISVDATRGNIYDCNGNLLAYNELSYSLAISDNGSYESVSVKNKLLNAEIAELVRVLESNGESIYNNFGITRNANGTYSYNLKGTALNRFLADVFGAQSYSGLTYNKTYGFDEASASPDNVMTYLMGDGKFQISEEYDDEMAYKITVIRYAISANLYARYKTTTIAENIGEQTIAYVFEHSSELTGVVVEESSKRVYNDSICFASIIGYTGRISTEEYESLSAEDASYTTNDIVGKSGLEQYYESYLKGTKGEKEVYINNVGKITEVLGSTDSIPGNDLYISIDSTLQSAVYQLLEQEIAGIVYSNIKNSKISLEDVYFALIDNNVIDISHFRENTASVNEKTVYYIFQSNMQESLDEVKLQLKTGPQTLDDMTAETESYFTYIMTLLKNEKLLVSSRIDTSDSTYNNWRLGNMSPRSYLIYCIEQEWIDASQLNIDGKYADTDEIYKALCDFVNGYLEDDDEFAKLVYEELIQEGSITGKQICLILCDQNVVSCSEQLYKEIGDGTCTASAFILTKINNLEITPAQLALDPCTGSCVMTDPNTGEIKALVSYPGYDGNKLANGVDAEYYASIQSDKSNPQWNYATQEETAPGSTFKMLMSVAGLAEGVIDTSTKIECTGVFEEVDNKPQCWIWQSKKTHGKVNVSEALRDSCNIFYYTLGYELAQLDNKGVYNDANGISFIQKYASLFGLDRKTGIEISESTPLVATEYPVMAAIGQSNNNYTTISLSRYVTAITSGNVYEYQLMSSIRDAEGNILKNYTPEYESVESVLDENDWDAIRTGMRLVVEDLDSFDGCNLEVAGKTGTAQQIETRPNHALFVGYCPFDNPEITISLRIAYGSSSHNAAAAARNILSYYFGEQSLEDILGTKAAGVNSNSSNSVTD